MAGGIAVVRSGVGYVEDGDEVLDVVLWRLGYRPDSAWSKKKSKVNGLQLLIEQIRVENLQRPFEPWK